MIDQGNCEGCSQRHDCREIYGKLGGSAGPSVILSVVIAFLSPIVVFIKCLAVFEIGAGFFTEIAALRTSVGLLGAVAVTSGWLFAARYMHRRLTGDL